MKIKTLMVSLLALIGSTAMAQQNINNNGEKIVSPQVNADKTVTYRLLAPKAKSVTVKGDWEVNDGTGKMKKGKDGSFSVKLTLDVDKEYQFRYLLDGYKWENDWKADKYIPAPYSNADNSVVVTKKTK